jgi:hypothetical protein
MKVFDAVGVGFSENSASDEVKDQFADIFALLYTPIPQNRGNHRPKLFEGVLAEAFEQFLAIDVARQFGFALFAGLNREIQGVSQEDVSFAVVPWVGTNNAVESFSETNFLHTGV